MGKGGKAVSAVKLKKKLENRAENACYLGKIGTDKYQIWLPESNKITTVRISDFIVHQGHDNRPVDVCNSDADAERNDTHSESKDEDSSEKHSTKKVRFARETEEIHTDNQEI